ncbi:MAG: ferrous iron transport protein A [Clostridiales bacterium]|nr:ferrous iron transport protein A [Clostridiales bacterium]
MIPSTTIKPIFKSIFGNPIAYEIRGSIIAIRNEDAKNIEISDTL